MPKKRKKYTMENPAPGTIMYAILNRDKNAIAEESNLPNLEQYRELIKSLCDNATTVGGVDSPVIYFKKNQDAL
jgi:hypothetical protein